MSDLISRQDAVRYFCMSCRSNNGPCEYSSSCKTMRVLRTIPSAEPNTGQHTQGVESVDCVSRQDVVGTIRAIGFGCETYGPCNLEECISAIELLPSVETRAGKWEHEIDTGARMLKCSLCGRRVIERWYRMAVGDNADKCPYCGAKMGGKNE